MTRDDAKEAAKAMLPAYLSGKGIDLKRPFHCLSESHADRHPSMSYRPKTNTVQCYGCGEHGDIFDVIRMEYGLDRNDHRAIFDKTYEVLGIEVARQENPARPIHSVKQSTAATPAAEIAEADCTDFFRQASARIEDTDYARRRGLSPEVIRRFRLGFAPDWKNPALDEERRKHIAPSPRLIIPTSPFSYIARDTREELTGKQEAFAKLKVGHLRIFNAEALDGERPVFVTEGEMDALSVESVGGSACALGSVSMANGFLRKIAEHRPKHPLLITLDRDAAGCKAKDKLIKGLEEMGIPYACVNISGKHKDANEALVADRKVFATAVHEAEEMAMELTDNQPERENLVHDMNQTLRDMKKQHLGMTEFWEKAIQAIRDTMLEMQEAATACNILRVWAAGLQRAAKEFGMEESQAVAEVRRGAEELLAGKDLGEEWNRIFEMMSQIDQQTDAFLQAVREKPRKNPLLTVPSIREAEPLKKGMPQADTPAALYLAAVKRVVLDDDGVGRNVAVVRAVSLLERAHIKERVICQGMMASPRLQNRSEAERRNIIETWMSQRKSGRGAR